MILALEFIEYPFNLEIGEIHMDNLNILDKSINMNDEMIEKEIYIETRLEIIVK